MTSQYQSIAIAMLPYIFKCYKENGFHILMIRSSMNNKENLHALTHNEMIDFDRDPHWTITKHIEKFEDIPEDQYKAFLSDIIEHLASI